jgi:hypothetical protein
MFPKKSTGCAKDAGSRPCNDIFGKTWGFTRLAISVPSSPLSAKPLARGCLLGTRRVVGAQAAGYGVAASHEFSPVDILSLHLPMVRQTRGIVTRGFGVHEADGAVGQYQP